MDNMDITEWEDWEERAESSLRRWHREALAMAQVMAYIIENCDTVSRGFLMHAQTCNVRYLFDILLEFQDRYALSVGVIDHEAQFACVHPSRCLTSVCRTLYPELYEDDMWHP